MEPENTPPSSIDDLTRSEMMWNTEIEGLFSKWRESSELKGAQHANKAKCKKNLFYAIAIPAIVLPLVLGALSEYREKDPRVDTLGFFTTSLFSAMSAFFNFSSQYQEHYDAESRYLELSTEIESILIKPKKDRLQADVCLERIKNRYEFLNKTSITI